MKKWFETACVGLVAVTECTAAEPVELHWLSTEAPAVEQGVAFGVPWPLGEVAPGAIFALKSGDASIPVDSWPLAYWPDGSLKWSGHAAVAGPDSATAMKISVGTPAVPESPVVVTETSSEIEISTGELTCCVSKSGGMLFDDLSIDGVSVGGKLRPVGYVQNQAWLDFSERYVWSPEEWKSNGLTAPEIGAYPGWHARLTAFAANRKGDAVLGERAWRVFLDADDPGGMPTVPVPYRGSVALNPGEQMEWGSINHMSQWSLNAIELLEFAGDEIPEEMPK